MEAAASVENQRTTSDPGVERDQQEAAAEARLSDAVEHFRRCTDWDEIANALVGSEQYLTAALLRNDAMLIGRIVLAVRDAMVLRQAQREVVGSGMESMATDEQAAALAFIAGSGL